MFTKASNLSLSWKRWSQSTSSPHAFLFPFMCSKYPAYLILFMITLMIPGKMSKLWSSCKGISLQPPVTPWLLGPHALLSILFSSTLLLSFCIWLIHVKINCSLKFCVCVSKD
jgi:hypothetical protein